MDGFEYSPTTVTAFVLRFTVIQAFSNSLALTPQPPVSPHKFNRFIFKRRGGAAVGLNVMLGISNSNNSHP